ncbi:HutD family protein [Rhizobium helianthi]|uniref:HutD family protein n=1 Tax=Rhizobium helianthi TaxID=1132695 RepID=A0ABW4M3C0_9HYPH
MQVLRAAEYIRMPWKNGGGETAQIAVFPANADLSDFHWRISMATVATDGPFSSFPGIDRTLTILSGEGMELAIEGEPLYRLSPTSEPLAFPADKQTFARLLDGTVVDLNVMTRRGLCDHSVKRHILPLTLEPSPHLRLVLCLDEGAKPAQTSLAKHDSLLIEPHEPEVTIAGSGSVLIAEIKRK